MYSRAYVLSTELYLADSSLSVSASIANGSVNSAVTFPSEPVSKRVKTAKFFRGDPETVYTLYKRCYNKTIYDYYKI